MTLAFLQHVERSPKLKDCVLGSIFPLLSGGPAKPTPHCDVLFATRTGKDPRGFKGEASSDVRCQQKLETDAWWEKAALSADD
jgi:hypothetical protein